jgi:MFS family permease
MSSSHPPVPPAARRRLALVILCAASLIVILDGTIVTVALPSIQADLGFTAGSLSWVMTTYLIAFGGLLLLSGRLGDLLGRKRMFLAGIAVFVAASLACGLAAGPVMLIAARFVQGAGAAMASAVTLGMIVRLFDRPAEQGRAIGAFAFTGAVGASAGLGFAPTAVVIAVVSLGLSARLTARFGARRLLLAGLVMITAALALLTQVPAHAAYLTDLLPVFVLFGIGGGLTLPAVTTLGMSGATDADAGVISGAFNTVQQVGGALGLATLTALAASRTAGGTSAQALTSGYHLAWAVGAVLGGASIVVAAIALREPRPSATDTMTDSEPALPGLASRASGHRS